MFLFYVSMCIWHVFNKLTMVTMKLYVVSCYYYHTVTQLTAAERLRYW